jgi:hypothetical protein
MDSSTIACINLMPGISVTRILRVCVCVLKCFRVLESVQTQMAQKPVLRAEVYARDLRASQNVKKAEVWVGARCA